jgi:tRNA threonylcarbamoyl adenosine modification protein YeaZ
MIFIINTSGTGLEFVLDDKRKSVVVEKQSVALPAAAESFIAECGAKWSDLTAIGVVVGPGSFTGIRMGIAYAKGLALGLNIPVVGINAFELYLAATPDAFVAIDSGRGDFFVASTMHAPCTMTIEEVETEQMKCPRTVGHKPFDLLLAPKIVIDKITRGNVEPAVPMYLRPSYAEETKK